MQHKHDPKLWEEMLIEIAEHCRENNSGMRFGQLLFNAISIHDGPDRGVEYDENFHSRLFNIYDEELAIALKEWFEWVEQQKNRSNTGS